MSERLPTVRQATVLRSLSSHPAFIKDGRLAHDVPEGVARATKAGLPGMAAERWITLPEDDGPVEVTSWGEYAAEEREALEVWRNGKPQGAGIRVEKRPLGHAPIRGWGGRAVGREVKCRACVSRALAEKERVKAEGGHSGIQPYAPVWFTNESGAQRDAEIAAGRHYLEHVNGTLLPLDQG